MATKTEKLNLRLDPETRRFIKVYCAERDQNLCDLFAEFVEELKEKSLLKVN